jgi:hypothetical protein
MAMMMLGRAGVTDAARSDLARPKWSELGSAGRRRFIHHRKPSREIAVSLRRVRKLYSAYYQLLASTEIAEIA